MQPDCWLTRRLWRHSVTCWISGNSNPEEFTPSWENWALSLSTISASTLFIIICLCLLNKPGSWVWESRLHLAQDGPHHWPLPLYSRMGIYTTSPKAVTDILHFTNYPQIPQQSSETLPSCIWRDLFWRQSHFKSLSYCLCI